MKSHYSTLAMLLIHDERAIQMVKEYHIFDSSIFMSLSASINNQIGTVCFISLLTAFRGHYY